MRPVRIAKSKRTLPILDSEELDELVNLAVNDTSSDSRAGQLREAEVEVGLVQVRMQNTSTIEGGATRLIYTVHLGGKPVPAETAAKDMALLSAQEVALELGAPIIIQSEREMIFSFFIFLHLCFGFAYLKRRRHRRRRRRRQFFAGCTYIIVYLYTYTLLGDYSKLLLLGQNVLRVVY